MSTKNGIFSFGVIWTSDVFPLVTGVGEAGESFRHLNSLWGSGCSRRCLDTSHSCLTSPRGVLESYGLTSGRY